MGGRWGAEKVKMKGSVSGASACKQPPAGKSSWVREGHAVMGGLVSGRKVVGMPTHKVLV